MMRGLVVSALALGLCADAAAGERQPPRKVDIAPGIHLFITPPYGEAGLDGNSVAIVSTDGVLVFDSNGTPAAAAAVLAEIRKLTDKPVKYLVHSHWHWDHWYGAEVYKKAFPGLTIVAHEKTRELMAGPAIEFNRPGLDHGLPGYLKFLERRIARAESAQPPVENLGALRRERDEARFFLEQKRTVSHTPPDVTFKDRLDLTLGERQIQVLNYGRAVTPGDAFLYLPNERVLITGDLLINPVVFALSSYPTTWLTALEKMDTLDARVIIPGHGEPLHDKTLLRTTMDVFRVLLREGRAAKGRGIDADQAKGEIIAALQPLMVTITRNDPKLNAQFEQYLVDWFLHRVYDELNGPLGDEIAAIPPK
jgi:glyoxylase-like metal-dependent hydrolase (beta-lactamase superfamily II)